MDKEVFDKLKKEEIFPFLAEYYKTIGRNNPPDYEQYSLAELKKCLVMFGIHLTRDKKNV